MFCKYCGQGLDENSEFCKHCGRKVSEKQNIYKLFFLNKKIIIFSLLIVGVLLAFILKPASLSTISNSLMMTKRELSTEEIINKNSPSVVMIEALDRNGDVFKTGSGFIYNSQVITNFHVISFSDSVRVTLNNGRKINSEGISTYNSNTDLALLNIGDINLKSLVLADSKEQKIGEKVVAIGSPLALKNTVSDGIISGFRQIEGNNLLQITAPIAEGSSGGALFNIYGEIIGITNASYNEGNLNFAIPINLIKPILDSNSITTFSRLNTEYIKDSTNKNKEVQKLTTFINKYNNSLPIKDIEKIEFNIDENNSSGLSGLQVSILLDSDGQGNPSIKKQFMEIGNYISNLYSCFNCNLEFDYMIQWPEKPNISWMNKSKLILNKETNKWESPGIIYHGSNLSGKFELDYESKS